MAKAKKAVLKKWSATERKTTAFRSAMSMLSFYIICN
ncbi:MAG: DUF3175 domain-containing protein [Chitinophagaceae bacterium]|nr:DUF3175 domain-containing protein [Chitinophagaceae bacterium]